MDKKNLQSEIGDIKKMLSDLQKEDRSVKVAFDTLYQELDHYKSEFSLKLEKQLLQDLLTFYDSLLWFQQTINEQPENINDNVQYLNEEFLELLRRRDVLPFPPSSHFNGQQHRVLQIVKTANLEDDGKIQKLIRRGFFRGEKIMRDEEVSIYRYEEEQEPSSATENAPADEALEEPSSKAAEGISIQIKGNAEEQPEELVQEDDTSEEADAAPEPAEISEEQETSAVKDPTPIDKVDASETEAQPSDASQKDEPEA